MFYEDAPNPNTLFQGDILDRFVLPDPPDKTLVVRQITEENQLARQPQPEANLVRIVSESALEDAFATNREAIVVSATRARVCIISQSCDIQRKPFVTVAAVRPMHLISTEEKKKEIRRPDKRFDAFWLPGSGGFEESFVDLTLLFSVRNEVLVQFLPKRIVSLSVESRQSLQWAIIQFFGRPAAD